jgi:hypothetical protein
MPGGGVPPRLRPAKFHAIARDETRPQPTSRSPVTFSERASISATTSTSAGRFSPRGPLGIAGRFYISKQTEQRLVLRAVAFR